MRQKQIDTNEAIKRVLMTPLGSRVMRPNFGSRLFDLVDESMGSSFDIDVIHYVSEAIENNLPEIKIDEIKRDKNILTIRYNKNKEVQIEFK